MDDGKVYVVEQWADAVKERTPAYQAERAKFWGSHNTDQVFQTRQAANEYIIQRSHLLLEKANKEVKRAINRVKKCEKKFSERGGSAE